MDQNERQPLCDGDDLESWTSRFETTLREAQQQRARRIDDLRGQIDAMLELLRSTADRPQVGPDPPLVSPSRDPGEAIGSSPNSSSDVSQSPGPAREASEKAPIPTSGNKTDAEPTDRISLADNLFGAGEIELALDIYQGLQKENLSDAERRWVPYQIATCHRRLGKVSSAEQSYRELASASDDDLASTNARWWLDAIGRRKRLENGLKGLDEAIQTMESEIREQSSE